MKKIIISSAILLSACSYTETTETHTKEVTITVDDTQDNSALDQISTLDKKEELSKNAYSVNELECEERGLPKTSFQIEFPESYAMTILDGGVYHVRAVESTDGINTNIVSVANTTFSSNDIEKGKDYMMDFAEESVKGIPSFKVEFLDAVPCSNNYKKLASSTVLFIASADLTGYEESGLSGIYKFIGIIPSMPKDDQFNAVALFFMTNDSKLFNDINMHAFSTKENLGDLSKIWNSFKYN